MQVIAKWNPTFWTDLREAIDFHGAAASPACFIQNVLARGGPVVFQDLKDGGGQVLIVVGGWRSIEGALLNLGQRQFTAVDPRDDLYARVGRTSSAPVHALAAGSISVARSVYNWRRRRGAISAKIFRMRKKIPPTCL